MVPDLGNAFPDHDFLEDAQRILEKAWLAKGETPVSTHLLYVLARLLEAQQPGYSYLGWLPILGQDIGDLHSMWLLIGRLVELGAVEVTLSTREDCDGRQAVRGLSRGLTRAERRARSREHFTTAEWEALKQRYDYWCLGCDKREPRITLVPDHVVPLGRSGSDAIHNIQPLCSTCNSRKGTEIVDYRRYGGWALWQEDVWLYVWCQYDYTTNSGGVYERHFQRYHEMPDWLLEENGAAPYEDSYVPYNGLLLVAAKEAHDE